MTARQLSVNVGRLLSSFQRRIENTDPDTVKRMRMELREKHRLIFVNARPYFRTYRPKVATAR